MRLIAPKRAFEVDKKVFEMYMREKISARILCGKDLKANNLQRQDLQNPFDYKRFKISDLLVKIAKGKDKSPDKKQENKYLAKYPVVVAKKNNNGIDGMIDKPCQIYDDKICIVSGGNGGGGKTYYCDFEFGATSFVMVCDLHDEFRAFADKFAKFYLAVIISERLFQTIQNGRTISGVPSDIDIKLPVNSDGKIAWDYMSNFVKNLQYAEWM